MYNQIGNHKELNFNNMHNEINYKKIKNLRLNQINKILDVTISNTDSDLLDKIAQYLNSGIKLFQVGFIINDLTSYEISQKIRQLTYQFDSIYIVKYKADLAKFTNADGILLNNTTYPIGIINKYFDDEIIIGLELNNDNNINLTEIKNYDYINNFSQLNTNSVISFNKDNIYFLN